jgi:hypothetical protein
VGGCFADSTNLGSLVLAAPSVRMRFWGLISYYAINWGLFDVMQKAQKHLYALGLIIKKS